jgi:hypothetical protein
MMGMLEDDLTEVSRMRLRDDKIAKLSAALQDMVDRWEPDCGGQDRVMWENACEALEFAAEAGLTLDLGDDGRAQHRERVDR